MWHFSRWQIILFPRQWGPHSMSVPLTTSTFSWLRRLSSSWRSTSNTPARSCFHSAQGTTATRCCLWTAISTWDQRLAPHTCPHTHTHFVLEIQILITVCLQMTVCFVSSRPHSVNINTVGLLFSGLLLCFADSFVTPRFLKNFSFLKGTTPNISSECAQRSDGSAMSAPLQVRLCVSSVRIEAPSGRRWAGWSSRRSGGSGSAMNSRRPMPRRTGHSFFWRENTYDKRMMQRTEITLNHPSEKQPLWCPFWYFQSQYYWRLYQVWRKKLVKSIGNEK